MKSQKKRRTSPREIEVKPLTTDTYYILDVDIVKDDDAECGLSILASVIAESDMKTLHIIDLTPCYNKASVGLTDLHPANLRNMEVNISDITMSSIGKPIAVEWHAKPLT